MIDASRGSLKFKGLEILNALAVKLLAFSSYINIGNTINYFGVDEEEGCIYLTYNKRTKLYGLRLEGRSNKTIKIRNFESFRNQFKNDNSQEQEILMSFVKHNQVEAIYIYSTNKQIIDSLSKEMEMLPMTPNEILSSIYHTFMLDVYKIEDKKLINCYLDEKHTQEPDILFQQMPSLLNIATDNLLRDYTPFQISAVRDKEEFSVIDFFRAEWDGVCHLYINLSAKKVKDHNEFLYTQSKLGDTDYKKKWEEIAGNKASKTAQYLNENCVLMNGIFILKDKATAPYLQDLLGVLAQERLLTMDKIIPRTLILTRDINFDILVDEKLIGKYFATSLSKDIMRGLKPDPSVFQKPDFYGHDINGNFFNSMLKANPSPHAMIFGTTGAGKSVAALKMLCQMMDYDFEKKIANDLNENRKIRFLNVGYTGGEIFKNLKDNQPEKVEIVPSTLNSLRFSLFEFENLKKPTEEEWLIFINFINLILEVSSTDDGRTLTADESAKLRRALDILLNNPQGYTDVSLYEIQTLGNGSYDNIINEILELKNENGEARFTNMSNASQLPEPYKSRFYRPTLKDLINIVDGETKNSSLLDMEQKIYENIKRKLDNLASNETFAHYSNVVLKEDKPLFYVDFDKIKDDKKSFISIGWLLISSWYRNDKKRAIKQINAREPRPDSFYFIEEAHNFLTIPIFNQLLKTFAKEVRKYGLHIILITQSVGDIDADIRELFSTSCFLFKEDKRAIALQSACKVAGVNEFDEATLEVFNAIRSDPIDDNRTIFMLHSEGANAFKLPQYAEYSTLFKPLDMDLIYFENKEEG